MKAKSAPRRPVCMALRIALEYMSTALTLPAHRSSRDREGHPGDEGHLDVFSTNAIGLDHEQIQLNPVAVRGHGHVQLDAALPNHAYATALTGSNNIGMPGALALCPALPAARPSSAPVPFSACGRRAQAGSRFH